MRRFLAILFLLGAAVRVWLDWRASGEAEESFRLQDVGEVWANTHLDSLLLIQPVIERYIEAYTGQWLWDPIMLTILNWPLAFVLLGLSVFFWIIRRRKKRRIFFRD